MTNATASETPLNDSLIETGVATAMLPTDGKTKPITVIGTKTIRDGLEETCLQQAINSRLAPLSVA